MSFILLNKYFIFFVLKAKSSNNLEDNIWSTISKYRSAVSLFQIAPFSKYNTTWNTPLLACDDVTYWFHVPVFLWPVPVVMSVENTSITNNVALSSQTTFLPTLLVFVTSTNNFNNYTSSMTPRCHKSLNLYSLVSFAFVLCCLLCLFQFSESNYWTFF